ncbi:IclR family transcriptional regulator [Actinokineospora soli]
MSQSLDRALTVLSALGEGPRTLDQLAEAAGVHKTTVLRLLRTLEAHHFVQRADARHYRLGATLFDLAARALDQRDVRRQAEPALRALNESTGHTVHLASYEGGEVVYIDKYESRHPVRMYSRIGKRAALHCTAVAKVLVSAFDEARRKEIADSITYTPMTENTITNAADYLAELTTVAERGYAIDDSEHEDFIHCVAAPIRDQSGAVLAAVSLSVPKVLLDRPGLLALIPELIAAADTASRACGWTPDGKD